MDERRAGLLRTIKTRELREAVRDLEDGTRERKVCRDRLAAIEERIESLLVGLREGPSGEGLSGSILESDLLSKSAAREEVKRLKARARVEELEAERIDRGVDEAASRVQSARRALKVLERQ